MEFGGGEIGENIQCNLKDNLAYIYLRETAAMVTENLVGTRDVSSFN